MRIQNSIQSTYQNWGNYSVGNATDSANQESMVNGVSTGNSNWLDSKSVDVSISEEARTKAGLGNEQTEETGFDAEIGSEEQQEIKKLEETDAKVRAHEQAHLAAGGNLVTGAANYQYKAGPDGEMYAVGGEVQIDTSSESDPEATIRKAQHIRAAALAPADPSGQDLKVAADAAGMAQEARREIAQENMQEQSNEDDQRTGGLQARNSIQEDTSTSKIPVNEIGKAYQGMSNPANFTWANFMLGV